MILLLHWITPYILDANFLEMKDNIRDEKLQYNITSEATKMSALPSGKIAKYEYLTVKEMLPSNKRQMKDQTKFTHSILRKALLESL